ncbi:hypothetical protein LCGC14_2414110 [marine sediment metagenome]|uniref:BppU N-terminal domain-containing protein n=1 Tax=marine sediment metagenome TaxID=412755 RepID=A0A0F9EKZ6_9ZZZZ
MTQVIFRLNDNLLELVDLKDVVTGNFANTAVVAVTLVDKDDVNVVGETWPLTMAFVAASNGLYRAVLKDTLTLIVDALYTAKIDVNDGANKQAHWEFLVRAETRRGT